MSETEVDPGCLSDGPASLVQVTSCPNFEDPVQGGDFSGSFIFSFRQSCPLFHSIHNNPPTVFHHATDDS